MTWEQIREAFPDRWVLVEALKAHSDNGHRIVEKLGVLGAFDDWSPAWAEYRCLHKQQPVRELLVVHTERMELEITESNWFGVRPIAP